MDEANPVTPPTFLATSVFWDPGAEALWADAGLDPALSVHGEQEYVFHGPPPRAGTTLRAQTRIDRDEIKTGRRGGRMRILVTVTEFRDATGRVVAEERNTGIELGQAPAKKS